MILPVTLLLRRRECSTQVKDKKAAITAPLFAAVILFLIPISEKLLMITVKNDSDVLLSASAVQLFIFAIPMAFYCKIRNAEFIKYSKIRHLSLYDLPFTVATAFTYLFASIIILYVEFNLFSISAESTLTPVAVLDSDPLGVALAYVIIPAIVEEFFFRSVLISDYEAFNGPVAVIISSIFFAMLHFSFAQFPLYFILGIILGTLTYVTGTTFPAMLIHLVNNTAVIFFGKSISVFLRESSSSFILAFILVVAFMLSLLMMLSTMENIYERRSALYEAGELPGSRSKMADSLSKAGKVNKGTESEAKLKTGAFLSPTFLLCICIFILITLDII